ncbi:hemerythrin-like metal-binding protein [Sulfurimonas gotlandica GD1]|uniref:Hemerythrin-like metal-binding protein n=2 Tax=Sulfurimonas TaxID=202746 RepID=H1FSY6_SULGG|nr:hemerythrin-like metal-binding protein [Sulfurimonas gotlandica GD1]
MDDTHSEFLELLAKIKVCEDADFLPLFKKIIEHTRGHFSLEEGIMEKYNFNEAQVHIDEHKRLLGEMEYFYTNALKLPVFGESYIKYYAYDKFKDHIVTLDTQLATYLKDNNISI